MTKEKIKKLYSGGGRGNNKDLKKLLLVITTHNFINACIN